MCSKQTFYKKLRKRGQEVARMDSLNKLHDLKHRHTLSRETMGLMKQRDKLKPKKNLSVQCRLRVKPSKRGICHDVYLANN